MASLTASQRRVAGRCPLLARLDAQDLDALLGELATETFEADKAIFRKGQAARRFFLILQGRVRIYLLSASGDEQILHIYAAGETFAEAAVLAEGEYPAWADALEPTCLLVLDRERLAGILADRPRLALGMMAGLTAKLHEFAKLIEQLSLKEVPARLAGALLERSASAGSLEFQLSESKRQLAARLGTVAETLSRALARLKQLGAIEVAGRQITIRDPEQLERIAES